MCDMCYLTGRMITATQKIPLDFFVDISNNMEGKSGLHFQADLHQILKKGLGLCTPSLQ